MDTKTADPDIAPTPTEEPDQVDPNQSPQPTAGSGNNADRLDPDKIKNAKEKFNKIRGNNKSPNKPSPSTGTASSQGKKPQNPGQFKSPTTSGSAQQADRNTGSFGAKTPGQTGTEEGAQQAGKEAAQKGAQQAGQKGAQQAGQKAAEKAGKAAGQVGSLAEDKEGKALGDATKRAAKPIARAVGGEKGGKVAEVAGDAVETGEAAADLVATAGADPRAWVTVAKKVWKYKGVIIKVQLYTLIFVFAFFFVIFVDDEEAWADPADQVSPLVISQNGPADTTTTPTQGTLLSYEVTVTYPDEPAFGDILLIDNIPTGTVFESATQNVTCNNGTCDETSRIVYWRASENGITTPPVNTTFTLQFRVESVQPNSKLPNIITGSIVPPAPTGTPTPTNTPTPEEPVIDP